MTQILKTNQIGDIPTKDEVQRTWPETEVVAPGVEVPLEVGFLPNLFTFFVKTY